jgi:hypothetical protein
MEHIKDIIRNELQSEDFIKLCILYGSAASGRITDRINWDIVYSIITVNINDFRKFASAVLVFIERP